MTANQFRQIYWGKEKCPFTDKEIEHFIKVGDFFVNHPTEPLNAVWTTLWVASKDRFIEKYLERVGKIRKFPSKDELS